MSTIADVAARAGVSKATASRALSGRGYVSESTRLRVADAARELAYVADSTATSLATGRTHAVGVIVPSVERWFFAELIEGIQGALLEHAYDLALYSAPDGSDTRSAVFDAVLPRRRFDGLIAAGIQPGSDELDRLLQLGRPLVSVGAYGEGSSTVSIDDAAAARIATEHLIDLGHTVIGFIGGSAESHGHSFGDGRRLAGYHEAMQAAGLGAHMHAVPSPPTMPGGYQASVDLLGDRRRRPSAVIGVCDEAAIGAIIAARRLGIAVPTELSVVGIDDHQHAEMFSLTTIRQQPREQGREAVRLLRRLLERPDGAIERVVAASALVVRNSTSPIR
ncbi:LacI family DNA-binding transcriptional regulator [Microbacterium sp.]|uniref:LacI family DNA-binding transcriptional regulator n=1 Tax=Microbacterium sp. TaxID=51671 RepID=UPI0028119984|nr:LacI family DNA-binding transcriptional regulator [Microbacterium sp.]